MKFNFHKIKFELKFKYFKHIIRTSKVLFWFSIGALLSFIFIVNFSFLTYQKIYENKVYQGVFVNNMDFGGKTKQQVNDFFTYKNSLIKDTKIMLKSDYGIATVSASQIGLGFNKDLASDQAYSVGRSGNFFSDFSLIVQAYFVGIRLPTTYTYDQNKLLDLIKPVSTEIEKKPVDALFKFENNRVTTFRPSEDGQTINTDLLNNKIISSTVSMLSQGVNKTIVISIPIKILPPSITTEKVNDMGIKELIGSGHSLFYHSIQSRIYNINLSTSRINGVLIAPEEVFSFDKALGDVSAFTGYQQAYVIQNGRTVLGDGGGVCQVSTTFFRALLNAGLPIVERNAHAYRVGYYEEDSPPGIDATIFVPSVDLKFKNDTGHYILVQSRIDLNNLSLAFDLYGTKDGRQVTMTTPVVTNQAAPPPPLYQDDPTLPKGEIKQTDFEAWGANVYFTRTVTRNGKTILYDKFYSNYRPWQAVYLRGTK